MDVDPSTKGIIPNKSIYMAWIKNLKYKWVSLMDHYYNVLVEMVWAKLQKYIYNLNKPLSLKGPCLSKADSNHPLMYKKKEEEKNRPLNLFFFSSLSLSLFFLFLFFGFLSSFYLSFVKGNLVSSWYLMLNLYVDLAFCGYLQPWRAAHKRANEKAQAVRREREWSRSQVILVGSCPRPHLFFLQINLVFFINIFLL